MISEIENQSQLGQPPAQPVAPPPEFGGTGALQAGLDHEFARNKTARTVARALRKGWVTGEQRAKAVAACEWMIDTGQQMGDGDLANHGVRGMLHAEANDLKRMEFEDKVDRLNNGQPTENQAISIRIEGVNGSNPQGDRQANRLPEG